MASVSADTVDESIFNDRIFHCPPAPPNTSAGAKQQSKKYEIHKGTMFLKNRLKKKWKEKYFVLYSNRTLCYWTNQYDFQYEKPAKDTIDLSGTKNIEIIQNKERSHKHAQIHSQSHNDRSSPSRSASWTSLSRKGSMDFGRIFGSMHRDRSREDDMMERSDTKEQKGDELIFKFRIIQLKKTFTFSIEGDKSECKEWIASLEHIIFGSVVHKGYLFELVAKTKKDKKKKWVKRWFIIYDRKELRYFSDPTRKTSFGMIALSNLQTMSKSEDHKAKKKYGQLLYLIKLQLKGNKSKTKINILASLSMKERDLWYDTICDVCMRTSHRPVKHKKKQSVKPPKKKHKFVHKQKLKVPSSNANTNRSIATRTKKKEVILPIPTSTRSMSKQSVFSVLSTSTTNTNCKTGAVSPSLSRSARGYILDDLHLNNVNLMGLRKDIECLQNEILCLKIQNAMMKNKTNIMECREEYVEDALLDCDQYLILDRDWRNWSYLEIVEWITNLEYGRYNKYKSVLFANMKYREMEGLYLKRIDKLDLSNFFGITNYADCCDLHKQIRKLTKI